MNSVCLCAVPLRDGAARFFLTQKLGQFLAILDGVSSTVEGKLAEPIPLGKIRCTLRDDNLPNLNDIGKIDLPKVVRFLCEGTLKLSLHKWYHCA